MTSENPDQVPLIFHENRGILIDDDGGFFTYPPPINHPMPNNTLRTRLDVGCVHSL